MTPPPPIQPPEEEARLFPDELHRLPYLVRVVVWLVAVGLVSALVGPFATQVPHIVGIWVAAAFVFKIVALDLPRLRNSGSSPWLLLLLPLPLINFVLLYVHFLAPPRSVDDEPPGISFLHFAKKPPPASDSGPEPDRPDTR